MRVLLDENLPHDLIAELTGHDVVTVQGVGWSGVKNGDLLRRAAGQTDAFVTMDHKLEFRAVVVMACDDEIIPLQERIETVGDDADLKEVYETERHLLYVACTRARNYLLVTGVEPVSEFLGDMTPRSG